MAAKAETVAQASAGGGHHFVAVMAFELVGISIMAIIADTNKALGNVLVMLMVSFLLYWMMTRGSSQIGSILKKV